MRRGRTASFTSRLSLNIRSLLVAAENELRRIGAVEWGVLLRFFEPPGLRAGPSAHPRSAQPEPDRLGGERSAAFATRRVAQFAATPSGGLQLVGARCTHRWRRTTYRPRTNPTALGGECVVALATFRSPACSPSGEAARGSGRQAALDILADKWDIVSVGSDARELAVSMRTLRASRGEGVRPARP